MPAWLPVLKTVLPYLTTIVTAAVPAFHARKDEERIAELQAAVKQNAESVRLLAEQMQRTIHALSGGATSAERMLKQARWISIVALVVAAVALGIAAAALWRAAPL